MKTLLLGAIVVVGVAGLVWRQGAARRERCRQSAREDHGPAPATETEASESRTEPLSVGAPEAVVPVWPRGVRERREFLIRLAEMYQGDGDSRLKAMGLARAWGHPAVLSLVRRGLRDMAPAVMREAALAMESFRGPSPASGSGPGLQPQDGRIPAGSLPDRPSLLPRIQALELGFMPQRGGFLARDQPISPPPRTVARTR